MERLTPKLKRELEKENAARSRKPQAAPKTKRAAAAL